MQEDYASSLPLIWPHSDLHLYSGPFTLDARAVQDRHPGRKIITVIAGDVEASDHYGETLRNLSPFETVAVAGNHDFWGQDYFDRLDALRKMALESGIHFLENDAVVIDGVRFVGCTLWTGYYQGHKALMQAALWRMRDHEFIGAERWWTEENKQRFLDTFGLAALQRFEGKFNPLLQMEIHEASVAFLKELARDDFDGHTVLVTHHAPSVQSLLRSGVKEHRLLRSSWRRSREGDDDLIRVASYASPLLDHLPRFSDEDENGLRRGYPSLHGLGISLAVHGHLHHAMDYGVMGQRVVANPRGRVQKPITPQEARSFALLGIHLSEEHIEASRKAHEENPEAGDGWNYDKLMVVDIEGSRYHWVQEDHQALLADLRRALDEVPTLEQVAKSKDAQIARLAAFRIDQLRERIIAQTKTFLFGLLEQIDRYPPQPSQGLSGALSKAKLTNFLDHVFLDNISHFEDQLRFAAKGFVIRSTPLSWVRYFNADLKRLIKVLGRVEQVCQHDFDFLPMPAELKPRKSRTRSFEVLDKDLHF